MPIEQQQTLDDTYGGMGGPYAVLGLDTSNWPTSAPQKLTAGYRGVPENKLLRLQHCRPPVLMVVAFMYGHVATPAPLKWKQHVDLQSVSVRKIPTAGTW